MNPLKCAFGVFAGKFLGFIIYEHGIEIDPKKIESINKVQLLQYMKNQVVVDFIVEHSIDQNSDESYNLVSIRPWKLFFDGSTCREGQGVGIVLISPRGAVSEQLVRLEYYCTNNQAEYEAILLGLQILSSMVVKHVDAFGDSLLVVQQVASVFQCFDG
jgi:hypothetical protein